MLGFHWHEVSPEEPWLPAWASSFPTPCHFHLSVQWVVSAPLLFGATEHSTSIHLNTRVVTNGASVGDTKAWE